MTPTGTTHTAVTPFAQTRTRSRAQWGKVLTILFFLLPPLIITEADADEALSRLDLAFSDVSTDAGPKP